MASTQTFKSLKMLYAISNERSIKLKQLGIMAWLLMATAYKGKPTTELQYCIDTILLTCISISTENVAFTDF